MLCCRPGCGNEHCHAEKNICETPGKDEYVTNVACLVRCKRNVDQADQSPTTKQSCLSPLVRTW